MFAKKTASFTAHAGFTAIELVMVITILGIIAVAVFFQTPQPSLTTEYETRHILNDLRYTQLLSMTTGERYRWVRTSSTSYQILNEAGIAITMPAGSTTVTLSSGVSFGTLTNLPNNLVAFDSEGTPYTTSTLPGTALGSDATIPIAGVSHNRTITIRAGTGYGDIS